MAPRHTRGSGIGPLLRDRLAAAFGSHTAVAAPALWGPPDVEISPRMLRLGDGYAATLTVTGYPAELAVGWIEPLVSFAGRLDLAVHIDPLPAAVAADRLRRQRARLESSRRADADKARLDDPELEAAAEDATDLAHRIARGQAKLFRASLTITVHATTEDDLAEQVAGVRSLIESVLMQAQPTTFRALPGWVTTLPLGTDQLGMTHTFDTQALAAGMPFAAPDLTAADPLQVGRPRGVFFGLSLTGTGPVLWDRFSLDTHNSVTLARSGAGKSYLTKLELLRSLYRDVQAAVIDPEDEYARLTTAVDGAHLRLGMHQAHLNPFDLPPGNRDTDTLIRRALFVQTFLAVLLGEELTAAERAVLDRTAMAAYRAHGITTDPATWNRDAPLLADLVHLLHEQAGRAAAEPEAAARASSLAQRLTPFVEGAHAGIFNAPTTTQPVGHLVTFGLRDLPEELKPAGTLLALDAIWQQVTNPNDRRPRLVVVDEAWLLLQTDAGARWLWRMAKASRKHWAGLALVTQDTADVLSSDLGRAVVANAATHILLRQASQAVDQVVDTFALSRGERDYLLTAPRGDGLLVSGTQRVAFRALASDEEHALITTDPAELALLDDYARAADAPTPAAPRWEEDDAVYFPGLNRSGEPR